MTIDIGDVIRVVLTWDTPLASLAQNVWHMEMTSGTPVGETATLAALDTQYAVAFAEIDQEINDEFEAVQFEIFKWDFTLHQWDGAGARALTGNVGIDAGDYLPHGVAYVVRYLTAASRRQGRQFIPGIPDTKVTSGVLESTTETALAAFLADWGTDLAPGSAIMELCTFNTEPLSDLYETTSLATGSYIVNSLPGYQRRRKPGVGI